MVVSVQDILKQAMTLPDTERHDLIAALVDSLDTSGLADERLVELCGRYAAFQRGDIATQDGPTAMRELRARYK